MNSTTQMFCKGMDVRACECVFYTTDYPRGPVRKLCDPWNTIRVLSSLPLPVPHSGGEDKWSLPSAHHELGHGAQSMSGSSARSALREPHSAPGIPAAVILHSHIVGGKWGPCHFDEGLQND